MANYSKTPIDALGDPTMTLDMPGMWRYWGPYMGRHIWRELNADGSGKMHYVASETASSRDGVMLEMRNMQDIKYAVRLYQGLAADSGNRWRWVQRCVAGNPHRITYDCVEVQQ